MPARIADRSCLYPGRLLLPAGYVDAADALFGACLIRPMLAVTVEIRCRPWSQQSCLVFGDLRLGPQRPGQLAFALSRWLVLQSDHQFWAR